MTARYGCYLGAILALDERLDGIDAKAPSAPVRRRSPRLPRRREARRSGGQSSGKLLLHFGPNTLRGVEHPRLQPA